MCLGGLMADTRMTNQRLIVLEYLKSVRTHPNAEDVFNHVRKNLPAITLATVYRNLNLLAENGEILRFNINNEYRFDADTSKHQHFVCKGCKKIFDLFDPKISEYALGHVDKGYSADEVFVMFKGSCPDCFRKTIKNKNKIYDKK